jgi:hypothetical protein
MTSLIKSRAMTGDTAGSTIECAPLRGEVPPRSRGSGFDVGLEIGEMVWEAVSA